MRYAILCQKCITIALWKLTMLIGYRSVGNQFSMGRWTVGAMLMWV